MTEISENDDRQRLRALEERVERLEERLDHEISTNAILFRKQCIFQDKFKNVFCNLAAAFDQFRSDVKAIHLGLPISSGDGCEQRKP